MWASLSAWFTPTVLFCILNLMIATVFFTSISSRKKQSVEKPDQLSGDPLHLFRAPSLLERIKSINVKGESKNNVAVNEMLSHGDQDSDHMITRSKSETVVEAEVREKVMKKSASEKAVVVEEEEKEDRRRPAVKGKGRREVVVQDETVDAKADDFINRFRQQLKLQRLDSILRYKEMLKRGAGR